MSKAVLISIKPEWCELIMRRKKTLEIRKSRPKLETPFKCYIYCTKAPKGWLRVDKMIRLDTKIIGEFVCDKVTAFGVFENGSVQDFNFDKLKNSCLSYGAISRYIGTNKIGYSWHISDLKIYDMPKELNYFVGLRKTKFGYEHVEITRPPQSWCYVEERKPEMLSAGNRIDEDIANGGLAPATSDEVDNFELMPG